MYVSESMLMNEPERLTTALRIRRDIKLLMTGIKVAKDPTNTSDLYNSGRPNNEIKKNIALPG